MKQYDMIRYKRYDVIQYDMELHETSDMMYDTIWYDTIWYCTIRYDIKRYVMILYNTIQCNTIQYYAVQYDMIQYDAIWYDKIRYNTIWYPYNTKWSNTTQYSTIQTIRYNMIRHIYMYEILARNNDKSVYFCSIIALKENANTDHILDLLSGKTSQKYCLRSITNIFYFMPIQNISTASPWHRVCY